MKLDITAAPTVALSLMTSMPSQAPYRASWNHVGYDARER
jgi:hypothetical protein